MTELHAPDVDAVDAPSGYRAARESAGLIDRRDRRLLRLTGRDPVKIIQGLITNDLAGAEPDQGVYAALLTAKGKMIADLRAFHGEGDDVLLEIDANTTDAVAAHFKKFAPPLFAKHEDISDETEILGVYGPEAHRVVADATDAEPPSKRTEDAVARGTFDGESLMIVSTRYTGEPGYDLVIASSAAGALRGALLDAGATSLSGEALEVLRIEAGRPRWGAELTDSTIPLEAGLKDRAISMDKGCYTGQEIIVRILHRGHVNWNLRGFRFGAPPVPEPGATLTRPGEEKTVARVTSACVSPRYGEGIGLGYARRELDLPTTLRVAEEERDADVVELPFR